MKFNLIIASKGDKVSCLDMLFTSLYEQRKKNEIKIYFVDQNRDNRNETIINKWNKFFDIVFICDLGAGLSRARNVGLSALYLDDISVRDVVLFPDDDCMFCEDFFSKVGYYFDDETIHGVYYRVFDIEKPGLELSYTVKLNPVCLDLKSVFASITSINFVHRLGKFSWFDEDFGLGAKFNSSEEILYVSQLVNQGLQFKYLDDVKILHPNLDMGASTKVLYKKVWNNSVGHGALAGRLWRLGAITASIHLLLIRPLGRIFVSTLMLDLKGVKIGCIYLLRRWYGC